MTKQAIISELAERHLNFVNYILSLTYHEFMFSSGTKWTAGQQMDHIFRSTAFLPLAFRLPLIVTGLVFGKPRREPMDYEELVQKYTRKLAAGAKSTRLFLPSKIPYARRIVLAEKLVKKISTINRLIDLLPDQQLDLALLPHPLLGKISMREVLYFTIYHVRHHHALTSQSITVMKL